ncbi:spindle and kinetochore-associated protein 2 [Microcaecilia unicolor]|uniref:Protein FAM33A n=1 Tax=Microcaecilia unicolor TaxID=1415580 RepID=A0A6P8A152_9AMPH|nr:spindle and kinetochore-associated protein 2 [Microcaecilia unicolor]XP_030078456.1 spindle and kinetochore-associated protein 2 [Microcaecilia unicolor]
MKGAVLLGGLVLACTRPPEECKLFNMETAVNKLEAMFQKAECDLDYIEQKLEFEIRKSLPDNSVEQENPVKLLEELSLVKLRCKSLCGQLQKLSAQQKETMDCIHTTLVNTIGLVQHLQHQADLELSPLSEEERAAIQKLEGLTILGVDA